MVFAFILVLIYMIFFYKKAGLVADIALIVNVFFLFGVLACLGSVLTLPGIAGIVLTLGMAVDSNVIIFERIKEELRGGKGLRPAIDAGYKNAYSAIIDGNVTTLITGIVLIGGTLNIERCPYGSQRSRGDKPPCDGQSGLFFLCQQCQQYFRYVALQPFGHKGCRANDCR